MIQENHFCNSLLLTFLDHLLNLMFPLLRITDSLHAVFDSHSQKKCLIWIYVSDDYVIFLDFSEIDEKWSQKMNL